MSVQQPVEPETKSVHVIYDLALARLESQVKQIDGVDNKLNFAFSVSSLVIGLGASLFVGRVQDVTVVTTGLFVASSAAYVGVLFLTIWGYRFLDVNYPPNVRQVWLDALFWEPEITKRQILAQLVEAIEANKQPVGRKIRLASLSLLLVAVEVILVVSTVASLIF